MVIYRGLVKKHKPDLFENIPITDFQKEIILNGQIVDEASMALFPAGELVSSKNLDPLGYSKELIAKKSIAIFQASFEWDDFFVRTDILCFDEGTESWSLYEVKSTNSSTANSTKKIHLPRIELGTFCV